MPFRPNALFSCLALDDAHLDREGTVAIDDEIQISSRPPVQLDATWEKWLGTIQAHKFRESGLVITGQRVLNRIEDDESRMRNQLNQKVHLFHFCLLLQGCAFGSGGIVESTHRQSPDEAPALSQNARIG
jgi:hypothetical protein